MTTSDPLRSNAAASNPVSSIPAQPAPVGDERPHRPADDTEQVYYEGSPMIRGEIGHFFLWTILCLLLIAVPILWHVFKGSGPYWRFWLVFVALGLVLLIILV